ncbi:MAG: hypothetical protein EP343_13280 [Deltaproteobacteria bacterium]|nr:MAG: hypothetical protein EP343_13280 [Deltaproteobacteria bacterium]
MWRQRFVLLSLVLATGCGFWMFDCVSGFMHTSSLSASLYKALGSKKHSHEKLCAKVASDDFHGAFREIDCLINYRRTFPKHALQLTKLIRMKFSKLHKRLQNESTDWRTAARWKLLYLLGTRMYPVENKIAENAEIPVYEFNGHHMAVPFWLKERLRGRKLGPLFHFDTHNDMRAVPSPKKVLDAVKDLKQNRNVKSAWHTISHSIYDCAMPVSGGILTVDYDRVVWGKPSWNGYPEFVNRTFFYGRPLSGVPVAILPKGLSKVKRRKAEKRLKADEKKRSHFRLYYDQAIDKNKAPIPKQDAWVVVGDKQRPSKKKFGMFTPFTFTILTSDKDIDRTGGGSGSSMFQKLLKALPKGVFTLDLDLDYFASVDSTESFKRKAGSDPEWQLDLLAKRRKFLKKNLNKFRNLLLALKYHKREPSLITIADSTYMTFAFDSIAEGQSEYTPVEHTAFLRRAVRKIFREVYGTRVVGKEKPKASKPGSKKSTPDNTTATQPSKEDKEKRAVRTSAPEQRKSPQAPR